MIAAVERLGKIIAQNKDALVHSLLKYTQVQYCLLLV